MVVYFVVGLLKMAAAKTLKNKLTPRRIFKTKKIVALVIMGFGILLLVQGFFPKEKELIKEFGKEYHLTPKAQNMLYFLLLVAYRDVAKTAYVIMNAAKKRTVFNVPNKK